MTVCFILLCDERQSNHLKWSLNIISTFLLRHPVALSCFYELVNSETDCKMDEIYWDNDCDWGSTIFCDCDCDCDCTFNRRPISLSHVALSCFYELVNSETVCKLDEIMIVIFCDCYCDYTFNRRPISLSHVYPYVFICAPF